MARQMHLRVLGTGRYLPSEVIPNSFFEGRDLFRYEIDEENTLSSNQIAVKRVGDAVRVTSEKIEEITGRDKRSNKKYDLVNKSPEKIFNLENEKAGLAKSRCLYSASGKWKDYKRD